jgi:hypothetical protein
VRNVNPILNYLDNGKFLSSLYGDALSFSGVDLQEIKFGWDGPIARFVFCLKDFPASPPEKWREFNTVQVELSLFPLYEIHMTSFGRGNKCNLEIERTESGVLTVTLSGESTALFKTMSVSVDRVSALLRES